MYSWWYYARNYYYYYYRNTTQGKCAPPAASYHIGIIELVSNARSSEIACAHMLNLFNHSVDHSVEPSSLNHSPVIERETVLIPQNKHITENCFNFSEVYVCFCTHCIFVFVWGVIQFYYWVKYSYLCV